MSNLTNDAITLATDAHKVQVDKAGAPYILHPLRVAEAARRLAWNTDLDPDYVFAVGVMHDVVEDTPITLEQLASQFPQEVVEGVDAMTHRGHKPGEPRESYTDYIARVMKNDIATVVKMADVTDNLQPWRLAQLDPKTRARIEKKYGEIRETLAAGAGGK